MASTTSRLKFGGLGVYCYRATPLRYYALHSYSILYLGS